MPPSRCHALPLIHARGADPSGGPLVFAGLTVLSVALGLPAMSLADDVHDFKMVEFEYNSAKNPTYSDAVDWSRRVKTKVRRAEASVLVGAAVAVAAVAGIVWLVRLVRNRRRDGKADKKAE